MGDAAPPPPASGPPSFSYLAVFSNCPLVAAVLAFAIAQSIKVFTTWYKENRWDAKQLVGSGGMPSSHSATVTALAVAVGLQEGFSSSLFATAAVFASVTAVPRAAAGAWRSAVLTRSSPSSSLPSRNHPSDHRSGLRIM